MSIHEVELELDAEIERGLLSLTTVPPLLISLKVVMSHLLRSPTNNDQVNFRI